MMPDLSWLNEPVRRAAVVKAVITLLSIVGVAITTSQEDAINNFIAAAVILISVFGIFDWTKLRGRVKPDNGDGQ